MTPLFAFLVLPYYWLVRTRVKNGKASSQSELRAMLALNLAFFSSLLCVYFNPFTFILWVGSTLLTCVLVMRTEILCQRERKGRTTPHANGTPQDRADYNFLAQHVNPLTEVRPTVRIIIWLFLVVSLLATVLGAVTVISGSTTISKKLTPALWTCIDNWENDNAKSKSDLSDLTPVILKNGDVLQLAKDIPAHQGSAEHMFFSLLAFILSILVLRLTNRTKPQPDGGEERR